jgi:hypothetical protein
MGVYFDAPPTIARFMLSNAFGRLLAGPVGSGKTTGCLVEVLRRSMEQDPGQDGIRYTRWALCRKTFKELRDTVLRDAQMWYSGLGEWRVSDSMFLMRFGDVYSELFMLPMETADDQSRLLSMQLTGAWLSEAIEVDIGVLAPISERIGRYPSATKGAPTWSGIICDTNVPAIGGPWHEFMVNPIPEWEIFLQPSGLSAEAENLEYLAQTKDTLALDLLDPDPERAAKNLLARRSQGRKYYEREVRLFGEHSNRVKRYVKAEYGDDPSGTAVFKDSFRRSFHVVPHTNPVPVAPVIIGQDFGRDPWSIICQVDHLGRLIIHEEVPAEDIGLEQHVLHSLKPRLFSEKYFGHKIAVVGDPAGTSKSTITEESNIDALKRLGLAAFPAPTNEIDPRLRAVEALLLRQTQGGGAILISEHGCPTLVRGLDGGYRYGKTKEGMRKSVPEKNKYSHVPTRSSMCASSCTGGWWIISGGASIRRQRARGTGPRLAGGHDRALAVNPGRRPLSAL